MLDDILAFASATLVDGGRLAFWMPTSNEEAEEIRPPEHPCLRIVAVCSQDFNKCMFPPPTSRLPFLSPVYYLFLLQIGVQGMW